MSNIRTPKGTIDFHPAESKLLNDIITICKEVFDLHGGRSIITPTFELLTTLKNKMEDEKLIFELADQGGDINGLIFDLTVPLARYLAQHKIRKLRRYQIGKVFRRDQPAITKGRYREFYQCDFDICGVYIPLLPDAEIIKIGSTILRKFKIGQFCIKVNHRKLLAAICLSVQITDCGPVCSAIDKLEKIGSEEVKKEIITKGYSMQQADDIMNLLKFKELDNVEKYFDNLPEKNANIIKSKNLAKEAIEDLKKLFQYLEVLNEIENIKFDISLARGLDYYTGVIFEAIFPNFPEIGSVLGGGRYDDLVGQFTNSKVPCVGMSVGIMRILSIFIKNKQQASPCHTKVYLIPRNKEYTILLLQIINELWYNGIPAEMNMKNRTDIKEMKKYARNNQIETLLIVGEEIKQGKILICDRNGEKHIEKKDLINYLKENLFLK